MATVDGHLNQCWECPGCGAQIAAGDPAKLSPPTCWCVREMEQKLVDAFDGPTDQTAQSEGSER